MRNPEERIKDNSEKKVDTLRILSNPVDRILAWKTKESVEVDIAEKTIKFWDTKYTFDEIIAIAANISKY